MEEWRGGRRCKWLLQRKWNRGREGEEEEEEEEEKSREEREEESGDWMGFLVCRPRVST
uniref:Uncharacterized protein n=1 Tax=Nelumbo nucifera TaxID=4432 RepID=A0A822YV86_NELNU|nr:TPA_asm: hypothetical protein HUJ06_012019 [Nelumbo nucifera]